MELGRRGTLPCLASASLVMQQVGGLVQSDARSVGVTAHVSVGYLDLHRPSAGRSHGGVSAAQLSDRSAAICRVTFFTGLTSRRTTC